MHNNRGTYNNTTSMEPPLPDKDTFRMNSSPPPRHGQEENGKCDPVLLAPRRTHRQVSRINFTCIPDRRVLPRARATLPSVLQLVGGKVYTRCRLPPYTLFGPVQGLRREVSAEEEAELTRRAAVQKCPLLLAHPERRTTVHIDISDENSSNWVHYVGAAPAGEANLQPRRRGAELYLVAPQSLAPRTGLLLPYSHGHAACLHASEKEEPDEGEREPLRPCTAQGDVEAEWTCHDCGRLCATSAALQRHLDTHDTSASADTRGGSRERRRRKVLRCAHCARLFRRTFCLKRHLRTHQRPAVELSQSADHIYKETECAPNITDILNVNEIENHTSPTDSVLDSSLLMDAGLRGGLVEVVGGAETVAGGGGKVRRGPMACALCGTTAQTRIHYQRHIETHRRGDGVFCCPYCNKTYSEYACIRKHMRVAHGPACYVCLYCKLTFTQSSAAVCHLLTHTDVKQFICECGKAFKRKQKLKEHISKEHSTVYVEKVTKKKTPYMDLPFACRLCKVGFKRRGMLVNHLVRRHPEQRAESVPELAGPVLCAARDYPCTHCARVYRSIAKRKKHFLRHHPGESLPSGATARVRPRAPLSRAPQLCPACPRQYSTRSRLNRHLRETHPSLAPAIPVKEVVPPPTVASEQASEPAHAAVSEVTGREVVGLGALSAYSKSAAPTAGAATILFLAADQHAALLCPKDEATMTLALEVEVEGPDAYAAEALTYLQFQPQPCHAASAYTVPSDTLFRSGFIRRY